MQLSAKQDQAAIEIQKWIKEVTSKKLGYSSVFYLAGYAGTGKTTIINHVLKDFDKLKVTYCAFTGKAASVMASKGNKPASTIHSLIYAPMPVTKKKEVRGKEITYNTVEFRLREITPSSVDLIAQTNLLVLDECSMVDAKLANDLMSYGIPILVLGDPGQLPPIGEAGAFTTRDPDIFLDEVHRQAEDSPIIRLATMARSNQKIELGDYGNGVKVISKHKWLDTFIREKKFIDYQMICGTNNNRAAITKKARTVLFEEPFMPYPKKNEPIICIRNNKKQGLLNGEMMLFAGYEDNHQQTEWYQSWLHEEINRPCKQQLALDTVPKSMTIKIKDSLSDDMTEILTDPRYFVSTHFNKKTMREAADNQRVTDMNAFDYSYVITCHKSQGSEWNNVALIDDTLTSPHLKEQRNKWLYTGITRARNKLLIFK